MSIRVSLRGMLMLIRLHTLRRGHTVGFLAGRLNYGLLPENIEIILNAVRNSFISIEVVLFFYENPYDDINLQKQVGYDDPVTLT